MRFVYVGVEENNLDVSRLQSIFNDDEYLWITGEVGSRGRLSVYDVSGRLRAILWSGYFSRNKIRINWSPRWRSGIYFVVLESGSHRRLLKVFRVS